MDLAKFWSFVFFVVFWIESSSHFSEKPNFADAFNTVICGLAVFGCYISLFIK